MKNKGLYSKRVSAVLVILLFGCHVFSQQTDRKSLSPWAVSLSYCGTIPVGVFASQNTKSTRSGFAQFGGTARLTADYNINEKWALVLNYDRVSCRLNASTVGNSFSQSYPGYTINDLSAGWWVVNNYQLGVANIYTVKNKKQQPKMLIENRLLMGIASATSPDIAVASTSSGNTLVFSQHSKDAAAFSVAIGAAIKSNPQKHLFVKASLDLCTSAVRFNNIEGTKTENGVSANSTKSITQPVSYISIGWGVGWRF